jgi:hypothetical protein
MAVDKLVVYAATLAIDALEMADKCKDNDIRSKLRL